MTAKSETICGYALADVRKSLWEAIDHRNTRAANRWTAELVATPGAVGSLWASYWLAWAAAQGGPTMPILLKQSWSAITAAATELVNGGGGWPAFRNDHDVRSIAAENTKRLLALPRQSPVIWPSREIILYDIANMRDSPVPVVTDSPVVLRVWKRDEDALELRMMAGRFLSHLETGDLRGALSAIAWTLMTPAQQGLNAPLKCAARATQTATLTKKICESPLWFWLDLGRSYFQSRPHLHKGWLTMHNAVADAFRLNYKRWSTVERMRILLAWTLQVRASMTQQPESIWTAAPLNQSIEAIDLPYKEIAAELADPNTIIQKKERIQKEETQKTKSESKMAEADAAVLAALGLGTDDI